MKLITQEVFYTLNPKHYVQTTTKRIEIAWHPSVYNLERGEQRFKFPGPHVKVISDSPYGVALREFFNTHVPVMEAGYLSFRKDVIIEAIRLEEESRVITETVDGNIETDSIVPAGYYVIKNPSKKDLYYNSPQTFKTYKIYIEPVIAAGSLVKVKDDLTALITKSLDDQIFEIMYIGTGIIDLVNEADLRLVPQEKLNLLN